MLSLLQESFVKTFIVTPDEALVCQRLNLDPLLLLDWGENKEFARKMKQAERLVIGRIERDVSIQSVKNLQNVLKYGEKITTSSTTNRETLDFDGQTRTLESKKVSQKINKSPAWAIREGLRILMLRKLEDNISNNLQALIDEGLVPESIKDQILNIIEDCDGRIQEVFGGNISNLDITEELLAEVQQMIIAGS